VAVAVVAEAAQMLSQSSVDDVLADPEAWLVTAGASLARIALAVFRGNVGRLVGAFFGAREG